MKQVLKFFVILFVAGILVACDSGSVDKVHKEEWIAFLAETPQPTVEEIIARFDASMQKPNMSSSFSHEVFYVEDGFIRVFGPPLSDEITSIRAYKRLYEKPFSKTYPEAEILYERQQLVEELKQ